MQRLHEGRIEMDDAAGPKNTTEFSRGLVRVLKVLEDRLTHDGVKGMIAKWQTDARADQIGSLILDGVEVDDMRAQQLPGSVTGPEIEDEPLFVAVENIEYIRRIGMGGRPLSSDADRVSPAHGENAEHPLGGWLRHRASGTSPLRGPLLQEANGNRDKEEVDKC